MAGESAVDRAAMARAASQAESAVTVIRGLQSSMNGYNSALQGGWTGQAATAFSGTYEAFSANFAKVLNAPAGHAGKARLHPGDLHLDRGHHDEPDRPGGRPAEHLTPAEHHGDGRAMSEYTRAGFGSLDQGQADFTRTYTSLQTEVTGLDAQLRSSLSAWDGHAQQAYYTAKAQWDAAMANMASRP